MPITFTSKFKTAPYYELTERFGMTPQHRLTRVDDRSWVLSASKTGLVRLDNHAALEVMAVDALLWLRNVVGHDFPDSDVAGRDPETILRMVRDSARMLLG